MLLDSESINPNHQFRFSEKHGTVEQKDRVTGEIRNKPKKNTSSFAFNTMNTLPDIMILWLVHLQEVS